MKHTIKLILSSSAFACVLAVSTALAQQDSGFYRPFTLTLAAADAAASGGGGAEGDDGGKASQETLAKAAQNPAAKMISVPFENNFNFGVGPNDATQYILNIQPVIPIGLSENWNLITRTIMPIINQPSPAPGVPGVSGLGDINTTLWLSPAKPGKLIWGLGPILTFPTGTDPMLGSGKWSAGPSALALTKQGHWVIGVLFNQQWSYAGWGDNDVSSMLIEPIINYNLSHGWYLFTYPKFTANWKASSGDRWTVPVGAGVGKVQHIGKLPVNFQLSAYGNVVKPDNGPDWQLRFQVQFLFPE